VSVKLLNAIEHAGGVTAKSAAGYAARCHAYQELVRSCRGSGHSVHLHVVRSFLALLEDWLVGSRNRKSQRGDLDAAQRHLDLIRRCIEEMTSLLMEFVGLEGDDEAAAALGSDRTMVLELRQRLDALSAEVDDRMAEMAYL
jgi:hypothetical protein